MTDYKVPTGQTGSVQDPTGSTGHDAIDNGAAARAVVVGAIEEDLRYLAAGRRVSQPGFARRVSVSNGASKTFRVRLGVEPYSKFANFAVMAECSGGTNADPATISVDTDTDTATTLRYYGGSSTPSLRVASLQIGSGGAIDFSTASNALEGVTVTITAPSSGGHHLNGW
jgi:hypothetical protein